MIYVVTGAGGSGKSEFAERLTAALAEQEPDSMKIYAATMKKDGQEAAERIRRHQKLRAGKGFVTWETPFGFAAPDKASEEKKETKGAFTKSNAVILLECMSNLLANMMFEKNLSGERACFEILSQLREVSCRHLVIVTNEIFSDGAVYDGKMKEYQQTLGRINQSLMQSADAVCEVVYSIPLFLKGESLCPF